MTQAAAEQSPRVIAKEMGSYGITADIISPGPTNTEIVLAGKAEETLKRLASMAALGRSGLSVDIEVKNAFCCISGDIQTSFAQNINDIRI